MRYLEKLIYLVTFKRNSPGNSPPSVGAVLAPNVGAPPAPAPNVKVLGPALACAAAPKLNPAAVGALDAPKVKPPELGPMEPNASPVGLANKSINNND